jgi:hypothetical protein
MPIPQHFCWTRFGTEAAQSVQQILDRKEQERQANGGMFFWGIGNAVGPSMKELLRRNPSPQVLFSPIKSPARTEDAEPSVVVAWTSAETLFGDPFRLPERSLVTSRFDPDSPRGSHYALVCFSDQQLRVASAKEDIVFENLRNILTGRPIGASQVTSVVERVPGTCRGSRTYEVSIRAWLVEPFLIRLHDPLPLATSKEGSEPMATWAQAVEANWNRRIAATGRQMAFDAHRHDPAHDSDEMFVG